MIFVRAVAVFSAVLVIGCSGSRPPASPTAVEATLHDTLNPAGAGLNLEGVLSEKSGALNQQVFDDFESPRGATIRGISWQGAHRVGIVPSRWYVAFIADNGSRFPLLQPDEGNTGRAKALYAATVSSDQVPERLDVTFTCTNRPQEQCGVYDYSATLTVPFTIRSTGRYWLCIQVESPFDAPAGWLWRKGARDNAFSTSTIANTTFPWDFAFSLRASL
jgi:hypothetical protein